jgi:MFS family permease
MPSSTSSPSTSPRATATPWRLPAGAAFALLAAVLFTFFLAAAAPSPLFVLFQQRWGFSSALLTVAFAVYALALLGSLLVGGSLSDHVGRRPVIVVALVLQAAAMVMFLMARSISGIVAARIVQGLATGVASGTLSAAVVEAAPAARKRMGMLITSVSPLAGLAVGALLTGLTVSMTRDPVPLVFGVLAVLLALAAVAAFFLPESVAPRPGAWASLVPRMAVPRAARAVFVRSLPVLVTSWALGGLFLSLVPSLLRQVFGIDSGIVNGLAIAVLFGMGAASPTLMSRFGARVSLLGMLCIAAGSALLIGAFAIASVALLVAGAGPGAAGPAARARRAVRGHLLRELPGVQRAGDGGRPADRVPGAAHHGRRLCRGPDRDGAGRRLDAVARTAPGGHRLNTALSARPGPWPPLRRSPRRARPPSRSAAGRRAAARSAPRWPRRCCGRRS